MNKAYLAGLAVQFVCYVVLVHYLGGVHFRFFDGMLKYKMFQNSMSYSGKTVKQKSHYTHFSSLALLQVEITLSQLLGAHSAGHGYYT